MTKEMLGAKVSPRTMERLERYADKEGISKSEATQRLLDKGLDVQESDMRLVKVRGDGGTVIENGLEKTQSKVSSLKEEIETAKSDFRTMAPSIFTAVMIVAISWLSELLGLTSTFNFLPGLLATAGIISILYLAVSYYQVYSKVRQDE